MLIVITIDFGGQNSTNDCTSKVVVNVKVGATFLLTRNHCNSTSYTCSITLNFKGVLVQLLIVFAMNFGGQNSSNGNATNLVVNSN